MRKRYYRTGTIILAIFLVAVIAVIAVVIFIYQKGLRYIKSETGIKYFGTVDKNGNILSGRLWFESDAANIGLREFFIVEFGDISLVPDLPYFPEDFSALNFINEALPDSLTDSYPMNNFLFNISSDSSDSFNDEDEDESGGGVFFRKETFDDLIKNHESDKNIISGGEIYTSDGLKWVLVSESATPSSYKDFEIVREDNKIKKYNGDILSFVKKEDIKSASFILKNGTVINLYPVNNLYLISYDRGNLSGDLYIGALNRNFEKNGKGLYYFNNSGDVYYGDFVNDEKNNNCELLCDGGDTYVGEMKNGKRNGMGYFKWKDGGSYSGMFKDNLKDGYGTNIFPDGSVYEGEYVKDIKEGYGKYTLPNGDVYEGGFSNDAFKGEGKYTWVSGEYYIGDFDFNAMHGWGTYYWTSGRTYEGWWNMGKMVLEKPE